MRIIGLRLSAKVLGYKGVIPPPEGFETLMVSAALGGASLHRRGRRLPGLASQPGLSAQPKAAGQTAAGEAAQRQCVGAAAAVIPHPEALAPVVPRRSARRIDRGAQRVAVEQPVVLLRFPGNCPPLEGYRLLDLCVAHRDRVVRGGIFLLIILLMLASREEPKSKPDWIDSMKATLSDLADLSER
ncbi:hypothetical protein [Hydrogenophaga sp.]|uniref:hypothetical protein n=1 Tax=Hydrogenophaga sp. TaxID=1904254 RepID=UPI0026389DFB|nr:hypothetical protein [Hydrogenophaga sp.]MDM7948354.1 hypothetical protein [Hydrogenophaga sp.]